MNPLSFVLPMAKYGRVYRTEFWDRIQQFGDSAMKLSENEFNLKFVGVDTDKNGVTWYYFQEVF